MFTNALKAQLTAMEDSIVDRVVQRLQQSSARTAPVTAVVMATVPQETRTATASALATAGVAHGGGSVEPATAAASTRQRALNYQAPTPMLDRQPSTTAPPGPRAFLAGFDGDDGEDVSRRDLVEEYAMLDALRHSSVSSRSTSAFSSLS